MDVRLFQKPTHTLLQMTNLPTLRTGLRRHVLDDQLLVYDTKTDQIHLLNSTTAKVLDLIEEGFGSDDVIKKLDEINGATGGADLLSLALGELRSAGLLDTEKVEVPKIHETTRRQMVQRIAAAGAAILVPAIITLAPQSAAAQGSSLPNGSACTLSSQCASGCCATNSSGSCTNHTCSPNTCASCQ